VNEVKFGVVVLLAASLACQVVHVDTRTDLWIEGKVRSEDGSGVSGVQVRFFDTGLDQRTRNKSEGVVVGYTDNQGRLAVPFTYYWGYDKKKNSPPEIPGTFSLILSKDGLSPIVQDYKITSLRKESDRRVVLFDVRVP
jgi:hypothetical protein